MFNCTHLLAQTALQNTIIYIQKSEATFYNPPIHCHIRTEILQRLSHDGTTLHQHWAGSLEGGGGGEASFSKGSVMSHCKSRCNQRDVVPENHVCPEWPGIENMQLFRIYIQVKNAFRSYKKHSLAAVHKRESYLSRWLDKRVHREGIGNLT